jgi:predicted hydrocarbon binding protein
MTERLELVNKGFLVILLGVEDVVGKRGMAALLRQADLVQYIDHYPPSNEGYGGHQVVYMSRINHALFDIYGPRGARAILQRVGRERWKNAVEENGALASATKVALKFLPRRRQVKLALDIASKAYGEQLNTSIKVGEDGEGFFWQDLSCGNCVDWQSDKPVCFTTAGFVYGLVAWATESENHKVEEVACHARGDAACRHHITLL